VNNLEVSLIDPWEVDLQSLGFEQQTVVRIPKPAAYILHKSLVAKRRRHKEKTAKDLYYIFYVLESFPDWRDGIFADLRQYKNTHRKQSAKALNYLESLFADINSTGIQHLLSQRPVSSFSEMTDDQFRQYALATIRNLIEVLR
jgi:hypothetical protein